MLGDNESNRRSAAHSAVSFRHFVEISLDVRIRNHYLRCHA